MLHLDRDEIHALLAGQKSKMHMYSRISRVSWVIPAALFGAAAVLALCATVLKG
jgi:hypothetical protein